jgi:hypothetical protein
VSCSHPGMEMATASGRIPSRSQGGIVVLALLAALAATGCGGTGKTLDPLLSRVDQARDAQALGSLQQAFATAAFVKAEAGAYGASTDDFVQRLQAKDPSKRFGTTPSTGPDQVQVVGGGSAPAMLVVQSTSRNYLAIWDDGNGTVYYRGVQSPALVTQRPVGGGWSDQPLILRSTSG